MANIISIQTYKVGDIVKGKVARSVNFGAFVELEGGIEGLCHTSELSVQIVKKPEMAAQIGQELQFKILKLDETQKKIQEILSKTQSKEQYATPPNEAYIKAKLRDDLGQFLFNKTQRRPMIIPLLIEV